MENIAKQINLVINNIAEKIGIGVEKIYPVLRKQALIEGIQSMFWCIVALAIAILVFKLIKKMSKLERNKYGDIDEDDFFMYATLTVVLGIVALIMFIVNFGDALNALLNPDWYIINSIIKQIK